eukprot:6179838-Pleurochrysis_carterae.AAC.4
MPFATKVKTMIHIGLRAIFGCSTGSSRLCNSILHRKFQFHFVRRRRLVAARAVTSSGHL